MKNPNILLIISDHLSTRVVGAYGEGTGCTPAIDSVAARGTILANAYTACPLCMPSRAAFWTSRYPHQTRVESNGRKHVNGPLPEDLPTVGTHFREAGYRCVHFGKTHDFGTLKGFDVVSVEERPSASAPHPAWPENYDTLQDNDTLAKCESWLRQPPETPFFCVADLNNPHNICGWVGHNDSMNGPVTSLTGPGELPDLPANFAWDDLDNLPLPMRYICCSHNRQAQTQQWDEANYRHYIAAFRHYTQMADAGVARLLAALGSSPDAFDNTLVVIMADHGDSQASHGLVTKQVQFYDEVARVPLLFAGPGVQQRSVPCAAPLASLLDLLPTLCGLAGVPGPSKTEGVNLAPFLGGAPAPERPYVASEWLTEWGFTYSPGRMIRTERFKYIRYREGNGEALYDLVNDPGEQCNCAADSAFVDELIRHRALLEQHVAATADDFFTREASVASRWRTHTPGWQHHRGIAAPMEG